MDLLLDNALRTSLEACRADAPPKLAAAIGHAVFPGGARVRPRLCIEVARACGEPNELTYAVACAVELLHCASLVHDDLPCFDDAAVRRGRPSVHAAYGEALAVLAGDALIVHAFEVVARAAASRPEAAARSVLVLARSTGAASGLVAGQAWELEPAVDVGVYHRAKTASLFEAAAVLGALSVGAAGGPFEPLGRAFGTAYQMADDVADVLGDPATLGKPVGRDRDLGRPTSAVGSADAALARLARAADAAASAVPTCAGESDLRRFVEAVFAALAVRCRRATAA